jgi:hypothetical protein
MKKNTPRNSRSSLAPARRGNGVEAARAKSLRHETGATLRHIMFRYLGYHADRIAGLARGPIASRARREATRPRA